MDPIQDKQDTPVADDAVVAPEEETTETPATEEVAEVATEEVAKETTETPATEEVATE